MTIELRRLREGESARLRELRLRALQEAPAAFAASLGDARALAPERWEAWTTAGAASSTQLTVVAVEGDRWLGMVAGRLLAESPGSVWLEALWVDPRARRSGLGSRLIEAVVVWARDRGAVTVELSVTDNNAAAKALYASSGFVATGRRRPLPSDPSRTEVFLSRAL